jgi:hypothetical protein
MSSRVIRALREEERELIKSLIARSQGDQKALLDHLNELREVEDWDDGTGSITLQDGPHHLISEAWFKDLDGGTISILLFAEGKRLSILELYRGDTLPLKSYPRTASCDFDGLLAQ